MKSQLFLSIGILSILLVTGCRNKSHRPTLTIPECKNWINRFGSLTSKENVSASLRHAYADSVYYIHLDGFKREWNFAGAKNDEHLSSELLKYDYFYINGGDTIPFQKTNFLNIMPDSTLAINCVLYFVTKEELASIDDMEIGYERIDVTHQLLGFSIKGGRVYAYRAKPEYIYRHETDTLTAIIEKEYAELVWGAYDRLGTMARKEFDASTTPIDIDLLDPVIRVKVRD